ncbi:hypothetical protein P367_11510 [Comamonas thiooxydans]|nr:hypothetical protein P609_08055 [Comamonas thiooxydans]KGG92472.1 hypothetical protein P369_09890 [Comamonas thiooxydans]KGG98792.1 hypothetical protein P367_11510 [Comamonas thiooxydans]
MKRNAFHEPVHISSSQLSALVGALNALRQLPVKELIASEILNGFKGGRANCT